MVLIGFFVFKNDNALKNHNALHVQMRGPTFWVVVMKANSHPVVLRVCQDNQEINKDL